MRDVATPLRPNSRMMPSPITNGGVMMGRMASRRSSPLARKPVRLCSSAKPRPSKVVVMPQATASHRLFQNTPQ